MVFREELKDNLERDEAWCSLRIGVREAGRPVFSLSGSSNRRGRLQSSSFIFLHLHMHGAVCSTSIALEVTLVSESKLSRHNSSLNFC